MSDLRDAAIQAMVESQSWPNDDLVEAQWTCRSTLDALLEFLDAHTEEWGRASEDALQDAEGTMSKDAFMVGLVAALRGTTEEGG